MNGSDKERFANYARQNYARNLSDAYETSHGILYKPKPFGLQVLLLISAFAGGPVVGWLMGRVLGGVSETAQAFLYLPPVLIFFLGYGLWTARLSAIAFEVIGWPIFRALLRLIVRKKKPEKIEDVLPDRDKLERMAVKAQKAGWSFLVVAFAVGSISGFLSTLFHSESAVVFQMFVVSAGCVVWGYVLGALARRGYLPFPEAGDA